MTSKRLPSWRAAATVWSQRLCQSGGAPAAAVPLFPVGTTRGAAVGAAGSRAAARRGTAAGAVDAGAQAPSHKPTIRTSPDVQTGAPAHAFIPLVAIGVSAAHGVSGRPSASAVISRSNRWRKWITATSERPRRSLTPWAITPCPRCAT